MTAIPTTDQILANLADLNRRAEQLEATPDLFCREAAEFAQRLSDTLPDISPAVAGLVLLHAADVYGMYATHDNRQYLSDEALAAVRMLGEAGQRLYLGDEQAELQP